MSPCPNEAHYPDPRSHYVVRSIKEEVYDPTGVLRLRIDRFKPVLKGGLFFAPLIKIADPV